GTAYPPGQQHKSAIRRIWSGPAPTGKQQQPGKPPQAEELVRSCQQISICGKDLSSPGMPQFFDCGSLRQPTEKIHRSATRGVLRELCKHFVETFGTPLDNTPVETF